MRIEKYRLSLLVISLVLMGGTCLAAPDIYRWVDEEGVVHFSEMPAANGKSELVDTRVTIAREPQPDAEPTEEPASQQTTAVERVSTAQQIREQRAIARLEAAAQKAKLEENCKNARYLISRLEPSPQVMTTNEAGEVVRMDDNERISKLNEAQAYAEANCSQ